MRPSPSMMAANIHSLKRLLKLCFMRSIRVMSITEGWSFTQGLVAQRVMEYESRMLWRLFQLAVMFAVLSANVYFGWTTNGYIAGAWAFMAAYALTTGPLKAWDYLRSKRQDGRSEEVEPPISALEWPERFGPLLERPDPPKLSSKRPERPFS